MLGFKGKWFVSVMVVLLLFPIISTEDERVDAARLVTSGGERISPPLHDIVVIPDYMISEQIADTSQAEIKVSIIPLSDKKPLVGVEMTIASLNLLKNSTKSLNITSDKVNVVVPNQVLKGYDIDPLLIDSITFVLGMKKSTDISGAVSALYDFSVVRNVELSNVGSWPTQKPWGYPVKRDFSEPIQFSVPLTTSVKKAQNVTAYHMDDTSKTLKYVGGTNEEVEKFTFKSMITSNLVVTENAKTFSDINGYWAQDEIEVLASRTITSGKTATTFNPTGNVTRAEFAVLIARALNIPQYEYKGFDYGVPGYYYRGIFKDVTTSKAWAYKEIETAYKVGIIKGTSEDMFSPDALITHEEMATLLIRAINYHNPSILNNEVKANSFSDHGEIGTFARLSVDQAVSLGIVSGNSDNKFNPKANATRAEAAVVLYRTLGQLGEL